MLNIEEPGIFTQRHKWQQTSHNTIEECVYCGCKKHKQLKSNYGGSYRATYKMKNASHKVAHAPRCPGPEVDYVYKAFMQRMKKRFLPLQFLRRESSESNGPTWAIMGTKRLGFISIYQGQVTIKMLNAASGLPAGEYLYSLSDPNSFDKIDQKMDEIIIEKIKYYKSQIDVLHSALTLSTRMQGKLFHDATDPQS